MAVVGDRSGNNATVTITFNVADILALTGASTAQKKILGYQRAVEELNRAIAGLAFTDTELDSRVTTMTTDVAATKAARPTGTL